MNEKYGIELEAKTRGFNEAMNKTKKIIEETGKEAQKLQTVSFKGVDINISSSVKQAMSSLGKYLDRYQVQEVEIDANMDAKQVEKEITKIEARIKELKDMVDLEWGDTGTEADVFPKVELAVQEENLKKYQDRLNELKNKSKGTDNEAKKIGFSFRDVGKFAENGSKKMKRFALSLLGARTAYGMVSRAMHSYMAQDQEMQDKMQSVWTGIGVALAPIMEMVANMAITITKYIMYITEALTGVDLLEKALAKTSKQMTKSLTAMDEITNLGEKNQFQSLKELMEGTKIDTTFADKLVSALKPLYNIVKGIIDFATKHPETIAIILGGWATVNLISSIIGSGKTGLVGIALALSVIAGISIKNVIDEVKDLKEAIDDTNSVADSVQKGRQKSYENVLAKIESGEYGPNEVREVLENYKDQLETLSGQIENLTPSNPIEALVWPKENWELINEYKEQASELEGYIDEINQKLIDLTGEKYEIEIEADVKESYQTKDYSSTASNIGAGISAGIEWVMTNTIGRLFGGSGASYKSIKKYDVGTDYVPNDQLAMIHEGERIIPKKFNSEKYFENTETQETNSLLLELIQVVQEGNEKGVAVNIDGKTFAKATYGYYQEEGIRLGSNPSVKRS